MQLEERSFFNAVFKFCEGANLPMRADPTTLYAYHKSYLFSQTIARLVREAGFDGMIVRGVHGENVQDEQGQWRPKHYSDSVGEMARTRRDRIGLRSLKVCSLEKTPFHQFFLCRDKS